MQPVDNLLPIECSVVGLDLRAINGNPGLVQFLKFIEGIEQGSMLCGYR